MIHPGIDRLKPFALRFWRPAALLLVPLGIVLLTRPAPLFDHPVYEPTTALNEATSDVEGAGGEARLNALIADIDASSPEGEMALSIAHHLDLGDEEPVTGEGQTAMDPSMPRTVSAHEVVSRPGRVQLQARAPVVVEPTPRPALPAPVPTRPAPPPPTATAVPPSPPPPTPSGAASKPPQPANYSPPQALSQTDRAKPPSGPTVARGAPAPAAAPATAKVAPPAAEPPRPAPAPPAPTPMAQVLSATAPGPSFLPGAGAYAAVWSATPVELKVLRRIDNVNLTFYDCANQGFCGAMYNGSQVFEGAVACSWDLELGTRFVIEGDPLERVYVCEDRGHLDNTWVDVFFYQPSDGHRWQSMTGRYGTILIVE